jgi:hypothetical protein
MTYTWKPNWNETRQHFIRWWNQEGLLLSCWGDHDALIPHADVADPGAAPTVADKYTNLDWITANSHHRLSQKDFLGDILPFAGSGPDWLGPLLGAKPEFAPSTVWIHPHLADVAEAEKLPPFRFDPENRWWQLIEALMKRNVEMARGKYLVAYPFGIENLDALASVRGSEILMMDMIERPEWVKEKLEEIHQFEQDVYRRLHAIIQAEDGSMAVRPFRLWAPGRAGLLQCDASAMFSTEMFERFELPILKRRCASLEYSVYHIDGSQCLPHVDALLSIAELKAIEWTPDPAVPNGGDRHWYALYQKILAAGKSVQVTEITGEQIVPLLDNIGAKGVYVLANWMDRPSFEKVLNDVQKYHSL